MKRAVVVLGFCVGCVWGWLLSQNSWAQPTPYNYVNVGGTQTVTGSKTWTATQNFKGTVNAVYESVGTLDAGYVGIIRASIGSVDAGASNFTGTISSGVASNTDALAMFSGANVNFGGGVTLRNNGTGLQLSQGQYLGNGIQSTSGASPVQVSCSVTNAGNHHCLQISSSNTLTTASSTRLISVENPQNTVVWSMDSQGKAIPSFLDLSGTPGSGTSNTISGRAAVASTASSATITNSNVTATSIVLCQLETTGIGVGSVVCTPASGSFTATTVSGVGVVTVTTGAANFSWHVLGS